MDLLFTAHPPATMAKALRIGVLAFSLFGLSACLSPPTIQRAGVEYDRAITSMTMEQLLLNIARARHHHPTHFTVVSNVAATFDFRTTAGITPVSGDGSLIVGPQFGTSIAENPTVSIVPVEGEEFTRRLLTPLTEDRFRSLFRQAVDPSMLLRLMARDFTTEGPEGPQAYQNKPSDPEGYREFRHRLLHLGGLAETRKLYVEPIVFEKTWELPLNSPEAFKALETGYEVTYDDKTRAYVLRKQVTGRLIVTNYDPDLLPNDVRYHLNEEAIKSPPNFILVDIRPGYPGGEYPFHGHFRLRSFNSILGFLARGIQEDQEYVVEKDPRSQPVPFNPPKTLEIFESEAAPKGAAFSVRYLDRYYAILGEGLSDDIAISVNLDTFRILYHLYQMTVTDVSKVLVPSITIAK